MRPYQLNKQSGCRLQFFKEKMAIAHEVLTKAIEEIKRIAFIFLGKRFLCFTSQMKNF